MHHGPAERVQWLLTPFDHSSYTRLVKLVHNRFLSIFTFGQQASKKYICEEKNVSYSPCDQKWPQGECRSPLGKLHRVSAEVYSGREEQCAQHRLGLCGENLGSSADLKLRFLKAASSAAGRPMQLHE